MLSVLGLHRTRPAPPRTSWKEAQAGSPGRGYSQVWPSGPPVCHISRLGDLDGDQVGLHGRGQSLHAAGLATLFTDALLWGGWLSLTGSEVDEKEWEFSACVSAKSRVRVSAGQGGP